MAKLIATPEEMKAMGVCGVCGEQATNIVWDYIEVYEFGMEAWPPKEVLQDGIHRFCDVHARASKTSQVIVDPPH